MTTKDIKTLFNDILYRDPTEHEIQYHVSQGKSLEDKKNEILSCQERLSNHSTIINKVGKSKLNIALMLIGHFRRFDDRFCKIWKDFKDNHPDVDIFIHTWNEKGLRSPFDWINTNDEKPDFERIFDILRPITMIREDHIKYLDHFSLIHRYPGKKLYLSLGQKVKNHKDFSKFIASQLYSIQKCHESIISYQKETGKKYDIIIKLRADTVLYHPLVFQDKLPDDVLFIHSRSHFHRDGGRGCKMCDEEYKQHEKRHYHHCNDVCDVLNYGSAHVMERYCNIYNHIGELMDLFDHDNSASLENNKELNKFVTKDGNIVYFGWCGDMTKNLKLMYPERMIREYMKDYWLLSDPYYL